MKLTYVFWLKNESCYLPEIGLDVCLCDHGLCLKLHGWFGAVFFPTSPTHFCTSILTDDSQNQSLKPLGIHITEWLACVHIGTYFAL
jgi:hypothetical protein